ncbi:MAG: hypothetical protein M1825_005957 [Sarcosagium campestre]|nr:MAG: hypothetical protein M1825_005957 [Sarcosagium campestre]
MTSQKPVHTLVLDAGPIIRNEPVTSSLLTHAENLITVPSVIREIRDVATRSRLETSLLPFLTLRTPKSNSLRVVADFARKSGDYEVLSAPDLQILALAYEIECERNDGDWRLRSTPGQKEPNGKQPEKEDSDMKAKSESKGADKSNSVSSQSDGLRLSTQDLKDSSISTDATDPNPVAIEEVDASLAAPSISPHHDVVSTQGDESLTPIQASEDASGSSESSESDSEGWITPSNIKKHQAKSNSSSVTPGHEPAIMQVATITTDFAMQNVMLQMGLNLMSTSLQRIRHLKTFILRCHGCFQKTKDMSKQFCPRCGKPTLTRVSCSTNANGDFKLHLKRNMQWNTRGNVFSIPKPVSGHSSGKTNVGGGGKGGGKGGWGQGLILAEDQKEYVQATQGHNKKKERDLMDDDYLPGILSGHRDKAGGRPKVGAGRNVNSRKR